MIVIERKASSVVTIKYLQDFTKFCGITGGIIRLGLFMVYSLF